jgi:hypothetical protein
MEIGTFTHGNIWLLIINVLWVLPWKGYALWTASRNRDKMWFVLLLLLNTFGALEIFYLFYIAKKKPKDIINLFSRELKETR